MNLRVTNCFTNAERAAAFDSNDRTLTGDTVPVKPTQSSILMQHPLGTVTGQSCTSITTTMTMMMMMLIIMNMMKLLAENIHHLKQRQTGEQINNMPC